MSELIPYTSANWIDETRMQVRAVRADGRIETIAKDPDDERWALITRGDPERNIAALVIGELSLGVFKAELRAEAESLWAAARHAPLNVAGRVYAMDARSKDVVRDYLADASTQKKLGQQWSRRIELADGEIVTLVHDDVIRVWSGYVDRLERLNDALGICRREISTAGDYGPVESAFNTFVARVEGLLE